MKIRTDFVTNSSSSSFCVIGVDSEDASLEIAKAAGYGKRRVIDEDEDEDDDDYRDYNYWWGVDERDGFLFIGSEGYAQSVGLDAKATLKTMTIPEACDHFRKVVKERYGINVPSYLVEFLYGEVSSG